MTFQSPAPTRLYMGKITEDIDWQWSQTKSGYTSVAGQIGLQTTQEKLGLSKIANLAIGQFASIEAEYYVGYVDGFKVITAPLPSIKDAMRVILCLIYGDAPAELQTWEKYCGMPKSTVGILPEKIQCYQDVHLASRIGLSTTSSNTNRNARGNKYVYVKDFSMGSA